MVGGGKFLVQFHGLTGEGQPGGLGRSAHPMQQLVEIFVLLDSKIAGLAFGNFLARGVGGQFADGGGRIGQIIDGQSRGGGGIFISGGDDEIAVVGDGGDGAMGFVWHSF